MDIVKEKVLFLHLTMIRVTGCVTQDIENIAGYE